MYHSHGYKVADSPSVKRALCLTLQGEYNASNQKHNQI